MHQMFTRFFIFLFIILGFYARASGQTTEDTVVVSLVDSVSLRPSSGGQSSVSVSVPMRDRFRPHPTDLHSYGTHVGGYVFSHPIYPLDKPVTSWLISRRHPASTDWIFYLFLICLFFIGLMRLIFPRYMGDLILVFRNVVHRQKQLRDQLAQNALPSLMLNVFSCVSGGIFLFFLWRPDLMNAAWIPFRSILSLVLMLMVIYVVKYLLLMLTGWLSGHPREASSYVFIVMMVNKVAGILLIPISVLLAYRSQEDRSFLTGFALIMVGALFLIRLVRTYEYLSKELKISLLNFIFLVVSFEVLPIFILGKALGDHFL
jgi:hypothetical protein